MQLTNFQVASHINHFTGDFYLPKRKCLTELFWFFFDKVSYFLSKFSTLVTTQKQFFLHFLMHPDVVLKKNVLQILLSNLNHHLFFKF
jgi:hypothetical protein